MHNLLIPLLLAALFLPGCAGTHSDPGPTRTTVNEAALQIPFKLVSPDGAGPFPAIVIMHDCSGVGPASSGAPAQWAKELAGHGYVVIIPDSFTSRGFADGVCTNASRARADVAPVRRVRDAISALAHLRTLPNVDGARIGLMGGSHGGSSTMATMVAPPVGAGFAAAVALYPSCSIRLGDWQADGSGIYRALAPLLILSGELDDWTPAEPCRKLTEVAQQGSYPVSIKVYPGAHHSFDNSRPLRYVAARVNVNAPGGRGATTGGNAAAWADSIREVIAFFGKHLAN